jgi:hypothetical protein
MRPELDNQVIYYICLCLSCSSVLGCLLNIFGFILFKNLRNFTFEMIFYSSISSFISKLSYVINFIPWYKKDYNNSLCQAQGFLIIWFENSESIWSSIIAYTMYERVSRLETEESKIPYKKRLLYLLLGYCVPLLLALISFFFDLIGRSFLWCYIESQGTNLNIRNKTALILFYTFMWTLFFISLSFILKVVKFLNNLYINKSDKEMINRFTSRLKLFPLVQVICLVPVTISRCIQLFGFETNSIFDYFIMVILCSQGIFYGIIYCQNPIVKDNIKGYFKGLFCSKRKISEALISNASVSENFNQANKKEGDFHSI